MTATQEVLGMLLDIFVLLAIVIGSAFLVACLEWVCRWIWINYKE